MRRVGKAKRAHHLTAYSLMDGGHVADAPLPTLIWGILSQACLIGRGSFLWVSSCSLALHWVEQSRPTARFILRRSGRAALRWAQSDMRRDEPWSMARTGFEVPAAFRCITSYPVG